MARIARLVVPGYPHHVTQRGNRRQLTFFGDDDYGYYRALLARFAHETNTAVWAYCIMPNHVHLVLVPDGRDGMRSMLSEVHRRYTLAINSREGWRGHLWQERFHSFVMDESHLLATVRYVELNPVAAGLCRQPGEWRWSSAGAHLRGSNDGVLTVPPLLAQIHDWRAYLRVADCPDTQALVRKHGRTGRPLGTAAFIEDLEATTGLALKPRKPGPKTRPL